ncbi:MAG: MFS transporter [Gemmatimonadota bacterium]
MLGILSAAELMGMSVWFGASAVAPHLRDVWGLTGGQTGWLTSVVQLGFVAGTLLAAILNLADVFPSRAYFAASALLAAGTNAGLVVAGGYGEALALRFLTGLALAGVYPPAMKMAATWFRERRGLAIGTVVGALTVGKASPYLVDALGGAGVGFVVWSTSTAAAGAAVLVLATYRDGPFAFARRPFSWALVGTVLRVREWRLATGGYLGHMWELYAFWTWISAFLAASAAARAQAGFAVPGSGALGVLGFLAIAIGGPACLWGGLQADRIGYERLTMRAMATSGSCALLIGFLFGADPWLVASLAALWGFFVIADSAQFSALVTEVVPMHAVGTALTIQTSAGFLLTMATIQLVPLVAESAGWRWAFPALAAGPALGILAIRRLRRIRTAA